MSHSATCVSPAPTRAAQRAPGQGSVVGPCRGGVGFSRPVTPDPAPARSRRESSDSLNGLPRHEGTDGCIGASGWSPQSHCGSRLCRRVVVGPVMRVTTLKASAEKLSGLLDYYAGLAEDQQRARSGAWSRSTCASTPTNHPADGRATADAVWASTAR